MTGAAAILLTIGGLLLAGLVVDAVSRYVHVPRVTLLILFGFGIGPDGFDLLPLPQDQWFPILTKIALVMVGFLLGEKFTIRTVRRYGRHITVLSVSVTIITALIVTSGLLLVGVEPAISLLLGGIATATAPAASLDVIHESAARGPFTDTLEGIVALDDALGLMFFSVAVAVASAFSSGTGSWEALQTGSWELIGAVLVGIGVGFPAAVLTGRIQPGEPTLVEALGIVLLCGGIALWLEVSFILAAVVLGSVVANLARHHKFPFHAIERIEWPFMLLFFVFAGASLNLHALWQVGTVGGVFVSMRVIGRIAGAWIGGVVAHTEGTIRRWMGLAMMPQAGVALGMALIAAERFPEFGTILPLVIGTTVLFEVLGPVCTRYALVKAGETGR